MSSMSDDLFLVTPVDLLETLWWIMRLTAVLIKKAVVLYYP